MTQEANEVMTSNDHAKTLGILFYVYVGFQLLSTILGAVMVVAMFGSMAFHASEMPRRGADMPPPELFGFMAVVMVIAFSIGLLMLIPKALAAYGLRNGKKWARTMTIVGSILALLGFPIGTALGVYGLWFVFGDEGKKFFDGDFVNGSTQPPPPPHSWQQ